jgi:hypothetical protein
MMDPWQVVPSASLTAYRYRREIHEAWSDILRKLRLAGDQVAVAGLQGAGKTVLFDHLSGDGFKPEYKLPAQSTGVEKRKAHGDRFFVIPGQDSAERRAALDIHAAGNSKLAGLIYVACNGFVQTRRPEAKDVLEEQLNFDQYLASQRQREAADLEEIGAHFRRSVRSKRRKSWILVVVNKFDLFCSADAAADARQYYEQPGSDFSKSMAELIGNMGADNLSCTFWPASSWPEDFEYGANRIESRFSLEQRGRSIALLSGHLRKLTHGGP